MGKFNFTQTAEQMQIDFDVIEKLIKPFDASKTYELEDLVIHDHKIYKCLVPGKFLWNESNWEEVDLSSLLKTKSDKEVLSKIVFSQGQDPTVLTFPKNVAPLVYYNDMMNGGTNYYFDYDTPCIYDDEHNSVGLIILRDNQVIAEIEGELEPKLSNDDITYICFNNFVGINAWNLYHAQTSSADIIAETNVYWDGYCTNYIFPKGVMPLVFETGMLGEVYFDYENNVVLDSSGETLDDTYIDSISGNQVALCHNDEADTDKSAMSIQYMMFDNLNDNHFIGNTYKMLKGEKDDILSQINIDIDEYNQEVVITFPKDILPITIFEGFEAREYYFDYKRTDIGYNGNWGYGGFGYNDKGQLVVTFYQMDEFRIDNIIYVKKSGSPNNLLIDTSVLSQGSSLVSIDDNAGFNNVKKYIRDFIYLEIDKLGSPFVIVYSLGNIKADNTKQQTLWNYTNIQLDAGKELNPPFVIPNSCFTDLISRNNFVSYINNGSNNGEAIATNDTNVFGANRSYYFLFKSINSGNSIKIKPITPLEIRGVFLHEFDTGDKYLKITNNTVIPYNTWAKLKTALIGSQNLSIYVRYDDEMGSLKRVVDAYEVNSKVRVFYANGSAISYLDIAENDLGDDNVYKLD